MTGTPWWLSQLPPDDIDRRQDVPLIVAMFLWDDGYQVEECLCDGVYHTCAAYGPGGRKPPLIVGPAGPHVDVAAWDNATGACFDYWRGLSDAERLVALLRDAWMAVLRDGVDAGCIHQALLAVPEFRAVIHPDELPKAYRDA